ncbi:Mo-dependent nitrogenase C-terminal domain-containing protein [Myxosarcina sp. GI1]|uniref:Mo-dependent nitrogenase C-terminal domain-containing protein n=1 Tax=Myxosarcina sp. GI1 TaxID=1541065 RepID=UPI00056CA3D7|nr:Mo-dependent nitrogenase C-terminal domain-containing protein [Myxosarcina sp. GI1]
MITRTRNQFYSANPFKKFPLDPFYPLRRWVNSIEVTNDKFAHFLCNLIPCTCPFERDVKLFSKTFHIPALCKLNPLYNEVVSLRLRALTYLEGDCGEDITKYIC